MNFQMRTSKGPVQVLELFVLLVVLMVLFTFAAQAQERVPLATTARPGIVKPDGSTITIDEDGTIHSAGGGGGTTNGQTAAQVSAAIAGGAILQTNGVGTNTTLGTTTLLQGKYKNYYLANGATLRTNTLAPFDWEFRNTNGATSWGTNTVTLGFKTNNGDFNLAHLYTDASNYRIGGLHFDGNDLTLATVGLGTGTSSGNLRLEASGTHSIRFRINDTDLWNLADDGKLAPLPGQDGLNDLGGSDRRMKDGYFSGTVTAGFLVGDGNSITSLNGGALTPSTVSSNSFDTGTLAQLFRTGGTGTLLPPNALGVLTNNGSGLTNWSTSFPGSWITAGTINSNRFDANTLTALQSVGGGAGFPMSADGNAVQHQITNLWALSFFTNSGGSELWTGLRPALYRSNPTIETFFGGDALAVALKTEILFVAGNGNASSGVLVVSNAGSATTITATNIDTPKITVTTLTAQTLTATNVVIPTNAMASTVVDFNQGFAETNIAGNFTFTGVANVTAGGFNSAWRRFTASGADRTITLPASWHTNYNFNPVVTNGWQKDVWVTVTATKTNAYETDSP